MRLSCSDVISWHAVTRKLDSSHSLIQYHLGSASASKHPLIENSWRQNSFDRKCFGSCNAAHIHTHTSHAHTLGSLVQLGRSEGKLHKQSAHAHENELPTDFEAIWAFHFLSVDFYTHGSIAFSTALHKTAKCPRKLWSSNRSSKILRARCTRCTKVLWMYSSDKIMSLEKVCRLDQLYFTSVRSSFDAVVLRDLLEETPQINIFAVA